MAKDINKDKFSENTKLKLHIFEEYFQSAFPVFLHDNITSGVFIFDFFAGSGTDEGGYFGSPLILFEKAKGDYCSTARKNNKKVSFTFNEVDKSKLSLLKKSVDTYVRDCEKGCGGKCVYSINYTNEEFKNLFANKSILDCFKYDKFAKFAILDQYGYSQVDDTIFKQLISFPRTDFIFFISSSNIRRFKNSDITKMYINTNKINFDEAKPNECHRQIAEYFKSLIPADKEYYLHHFTMKNSGGNYWGLIFGTNHTLGMEKFLKICWKHDELSGESNFNIDSNFEKDSLFYDGNETIKKQTIKVDICGKILSGEISDNKTGLKYALMKGCLPKLFTDVVKELEKNKRIKRNGNLNYVSSEIHKVELYKIEVCNENNKN